MNDNINPVELVRAANDNDGGFGDGNGWWIILLFLFLGWGNNGWGGNHGNVGGDTLYPWMNSAETVMNGFANVQNALCSGFAGTTAAITNGFANAETAATSRQMANMQQMFDLSSQLANCCCENRLATANQTATILAENCADRQAISDGVRDILANQTASVQRILDKMCDQELYAERRENDNLRQQINMMNLAASQNLQTAQLLADNAAQTSALEQYLAPVPRPAYVVQNPNCCQQNFGCGCGSF